MSAPLAWIHERLDEACARVQREAAAEADRILSEMETFDEYSFTEQKAQLRRTGTWGPERKPWSRWEIRRVIFPRVLRELDTL